MSNAKPRRWKALRRLDCASLNGRDDAPGGLGMEGWFIGMANFGALEVTSSQFCCCGGSRCAEYFI